MQSELLHLRFPARLTRPLALTHVNVIPMDSDRILADQTVVSVDGRIAAIGPTATVEVAESDDARREQRRTELGEPYRTVLGHLRHGLGHYFQPLLVSGDADWDASRELFGDERADYGEALERHYESGPPVDWQERFVSAYATMHPWEDWAETWAHYMHMTDLLETTFDCGLTLRPKRAGLPKMQPSPDLIATTPSAFDAMIESWYALTYILNNLNRGMGLADAYPFVLSTPVVQKLRFIHEVIAAHPSRFSGFAALALQDGDAAAKELDVGAVGLAALRRRRKG